MWYRKLLTADTINWSPYRSAFRALLADSWRHPRQQQVLRHTPPTSHRSTTYGLLTPGPGRLHVARSRLRLAQLQRNSAGLTCEEEAA